MHRNLRSFLDRLRSENDLVEIQAEVDPYLELAEIHRRVIERGGPALLFRNVKGSRIPVVTNLFGTKKRIDLAFGTRPGEFVRGMVHAAESLLPPTPSKLWSQRRLAFDLLKIGTGSRRLAPVLEVAKRPADLDELPLLTTWQEDGGPFITLPLVYTESPSTGRHNLGMYRIQRFDGSTTGIHWQIHKGGGFHYSEAEHQNEPLPVTIFLGGPPALILAAIAPLPEDVPELMFASLLLGERIPLAKNPELGGHRLVAEAEFAIVGTVQPFERRPEGPFGDHYGYYSLQHDYPVFHAQTIFHRRNPIYPATVVGKPRQEDFFIGDYLQELLSPIFPLVMPAVRDLWSYGETGFHSLAAAIVKERYPREALVSGFRILGEGQLSLTKFLILTDQSVDLRDFRKLLKTVLERARLESDFFIFGNLAMDTLDYTSGTVNRGSKAILIGVGDSIRALPEEFNGSLPSFVKKLKIFCPGCLVVEGKGFSSDPGLGQRIAATPEFANWPMVVLHDNVDVADQVSDFLWATWTRFEPASDVWTAGMEVKKHHIAYEGPIVIDARMKPFYPEELIVEPSVSRLVDNRWGDYFPANSNWR